MRADLSKVARQSAKRLVQMIGFASGTSRHVNRLNKHNLRGMRLTVFGYI